MLLLKGLVVVLGAGLGLVGLGLLLVGMRRSGDVWALPFWRALPWTAAGVVLSLIGFGLVVVPSGRAGVRVSQTGGVRPGSLGPGVHFALPLVEDVVIYDVREHVLTTVTAADPKARGEALRAQTKEGLEVGLAVSVRYRLDVRRLDYVHANLPGIEEVAPPVVAAVFRQIVPNYMVREVFATRREEIRASAEKVIAEKLGGDAILVKEVMLRDVALPPEYARGLEGLLLKEQESERMAYDIQIKEKEVKNAELEAEAAKVRQVKQAEAQAAVRVLQAKAEADAMQHTLPLKEKQIEQSRLEAEARKEATLKNAEAAAQAKVIDSKADVERSNLMAGAEAHRIRVTSLAENEKLKLESEVLRENPLLIQKIVAERLSDKMQIMMVPNGWPELLRERDLPRGDAGGRAARARALGPEDRGQEVMMTLRALAVLLLAAPLAHGQASETWRKWNQPAEPYRIMGPLYYVGASDITAFLVATPEGHILINSGFEETAPLIEASVRKLGFRFEDVKILLTSHVHIDHAAGHARIRERTGAKVLVMEGDQDVLAAGGKGDFRFGGQHAWTPCPVDRVLRDGETVTLGGVTLTAHRTPGHTKGCTTWTMDLEDGARKYRAVVICSMSINPGVRLLANWAYPAIAEDYQKTFGLLRDLRGEVFLGAHVQLYDGAEKEKKLRAGARPNPFVDPEGYRRAVDEAERRFRDQLSRERSGAAAWPPSEGRVLDDVPSPVDPGARYVLYLHGRILEQQGREAVSPDFGRYEYDAILRALADRGYTVIGDLRTSAAGPEYAGRVAERVRRLLKAGVPPGNVIVVGASKGGSLALLTAAELGEDQVRFAVLAGCGSDSVALGPRLRGRLLSVYDDKDRFHPSCAATFEHAPHLAGRKEVVVSAGLDHGLLYAPRSEWLEPVVEWSRADAPTR